MVKEFDVIVIGSGVSGMGTASSLAAEGKRVAIIEGDLWGGTCPNRGCDPKKVLVSAVEARDHINQLQGKGLNTVPKVNWPELMAFKETFTSPVPDQMKGSLESSGVETFTGKAAFVDETHLAVNGNELKADHFIIAAGARPSILDIEGKEHFLTSEDFLSLPEMPDTITLVGGGYIAFEFAAIANAAGARVHVIQHNDKPLKDFDKELVDQLVQQLENKGVQFHYNVDITKIEKTSIGFSITDDTNFELNTDLVFCTTGRIPNIETLELENAGIEYDKKGITVNNHLQTSNLAVFAIGDILSKPQPKLTPVCTFEANYVVSYMTGKDTEPIAYPSIPTIVFSGPKLAQVGLMIDENNDTHERSTIDATRWFNYHRTNEPISSIIIVKEKQSGLLVGAACLNNEADNLINYFSQLIEQKVPASEVADRIYAYPTVASDLSSLYA
ncbi:dihydrolipoyl dehydrogenase family protein [Marinilactibacillus kalidii]|uniref:dihydrolipoyl dehydrogenase family protein n=1 Tax=Marinilactibacillus kalidii TaxID=2820274 RepID=UPI001ABE3EA2|nr:NAD(P)/FAD-dependent oxidoreductase [Marinilactibacillus kalidii]